MTINDIKKIIIENCDLDIDIERMDDDILLFNNEKFELDSLDTFELANALEVNYKIPMEKYKDNFQEVFYSPKAIYNFILKGDGTN